MSAPPQADTPRLSRARQLAYSMVLLLLVAGVAELLAFAYASLLATREVLDVRPVLAARVRAGTSARANALYTATYDSELGWVNRRGFDFYGDPQLYAYDAQGARESARPFDDTLLSSYGDSFTHGDEVAAYETWIYRLGERLQTNALNFGVGGYGTDQAVLRIEKNCRLGACTPVVVLGICSENVNRTLGNLRAFYTNDRCLPCATNGPKPMFRRAAGGFELLPIASAPTPESFLASVDQARRHDFWYRGVSFPFVFGLARLYARGSLARDCGPHCVGRWDLAEARALMIFLLKRFVGLSRAYDFAPVVVLIPCCGDFQRLEVGLDPGYRLLLPDIARTPELAGLPVVDVLAGGLRPDFRKYTFGHPSPAGHDMIADALAPVVAPLVAAARAR